MEDKFFDWTIIEGATIVPCSVKTKRNKKNFKIGQNLFSFKVKYDPFIFAEILNQGQPRVTKPRDKYTYKE